MNSNNLNLCIEDINKILIRDVNGKYIVFNGEKYINRLPNISGKQIVNVN